MKTAVEWLKDELIRVGYFEDMVPNIIFEQAKAMDKEQIIEAWKDGSETEYQYHVNGEFKRCSNDYYNEIYQNEG